MRKKMYPKWIFGILISVLLAGPFGRLDRAALAEAGPGNCLPRPSTADSVRVAIRSEGSLTVLAETLYGEPSPFILRAAGRTMVPIGIIGRQLPDTRVTWDGGARTATFERRDRTVVFVFPQDGLEATRLIIDGTEIASNLLMEVRPYICNGRIFVPLRFVGESLNFEVEWDDATKTAILDLDQQVQSAFERIDDDGQEGGFSGSNFLPTGCISWGSLSYRNGVSGGKGTVKVYCTPNQYRNIAITVGITARNLRPGAVFQDVDSQSGGCPRAWTSCSLSLPFAAISDRTKLYRLSADVTISGQPRVNLGGGPPQWVFNLNGMPYPEVWWPPRGQVPFPSYDGPWTPNRSQTGDRDGFKAKCDALYASKEWDANLPLLFDDRQQYERHHIHPLEFGGSDNGYTNCVKLPTFLHLEFSRWWDSFNDR